MNKSPKMLADNFPGSLFGRLVVVTQAVKSSGRGRERIRLSARKSLRPLGGGLGVPLTFSSVSSRRRTILDASDAFNVPRF